MTAAAAITPAGTIDTTTQGTWKTVYGNDGYILFSFTGTPVPGGTDAASLPSYISNYSTNMERLAWAANTSDAMTCSSPAGALAISAASTPLTIRDHHAGPQPDQGLHPTPVSAGLPFRRPFGVNLSFTGAGLTGTNSDPHAPQATAVSYHGPCHGRHDTS